MSNNPDDIATPTLEPDTIFSIPSPSPLPLSHSVYSPPSGGCDYTTCLNTSATSPSSNRNMEDRHYALTLSNRISEERIRIAEEKLFDTQCQLDLAFKTVTLVHTTTSKLLDKVPCQMAQQDFEGCMKVDHQLSHYIPNVREGMERSLSEGFYQKIIQGMVESKVKEVWERSIRSGSDPEKTLQDLFEKSEVRAKGSYEPNSTKRTLLHGTELTKEYLTAKKYSLIIPNEKTEIELPTLGRNTYDLIVYFKSSLGTSKLPEGKRPLWPDEYTSR
ncbi:hypothetical protein I204_01738 [Kwoniella mangroviensis CBS 8886]|uniref:uncharacterized protein n=1 Tax=Kwoniella mangroviensis CBS 8507 TaxID=1296122 RepID=UPI00080D0B29|nr:uncharacterized protein I203_03957 [Kwoniella mangroviensis CBS 8507]OCF67269.1 hypothetical protein I203_03957 [Kwoniella mangroviensis CBS 8507]OCF77738.1 hypothetical protein I204_01738 [Kwoniella mangroviensis CBS 8886]